MFEKWLPIHSLATSRSQSSSRRAVGAVGAVGAPPPHILADQLTLSQPEGQIACPPHLQIIIYQKPPTPPSKFTDLPSVLSRTKLG